MLLTSLLVLIMVLVIWLIDGLMKDWGPELNNVGLQYVMYYEVEGFSKLGNHVDTITAGYNMVILDNPDEVLNHVDVAPFSD